MIDGYFDYKGQDECISVDIWYLQGGLLKKASALCPHGLDEVPYNKLVSDRHTKAVLGWIESVAIPQSKPNSWDETRIGFMSDYRGYLSDYPADESTVHSWPNDLRSLIEPVLRSSSMTDILSGRLSLPSCIHDKAPLAKEIRECMKRYRESEPVQTYLRGKAVAMADFWAGKVGDLGSSGDGMADALHAWVRASEAMPAPHTDCQRFRNALVEDIMTNFSKGRVPFYDTDYGVGHALMDVLVKSGTKHLAGSFPWKTWLHFDFADAPPIVQSAAQGAR